MTQPGRAIYNNDHDGIGIPQMKRLIWELAGGKFHTDGRHIPNGFAVAEIHKYKLRLGWTVYVVDHPVHGKQTLMDKEGTPFKWSELLGAMRRDISRRIPHVAEEVAAMRKHSHCNFPGTDHRVLNKRIREETKHLYDKNYKPAGAVVEVIDTDPIREGRNSYDVKSMQTRYNEAHKRWFAQEYPSAMKDGHYVAQKYPDCSTTNGIQNLITNYLKWMGHLANRTNNQGQARKKEVDKFNIFTGKLEKITIGVQYTKSHSQDGMQDVDCNLKHPKHPYGIPWKIEVKVGRDKLSDKQKIYAARVKKTGAVHSVVTSDVSFFSQYDGLMQE